MKIFRLIALVLLTAAAADGQAQIRQPITHETLWMMHRVGAPSVSPDGKWVVYSRTEPSYDEKKEVVDLWIVPADGSGKPRRLTTAKGSESGVAWSEDSRRIAFAAKRGDDEVNQIYVLDVTGGEAHRITNGPFAARSPKFSPDGSTILYLSSSFPGAADEEENRKLAAEKKDRKYNVRIYDSFPIRRWDVWIDEMQTHLFVTKIDEDPETKSRDLLAGTKLAASPGFAGRSSEGSSQDLDPEWSPDGRSIVFVATERQHESAFSTTNLDLYEVAVTGGEPKKLTTGNDELSNPRFSPRGDMLCYKVSAGHNVLYALDRLGCSPWPWNGTVNKVTASFDRSVSSWAFSPDSKTIYFTAEDSGYERIYRVPVGGGAATMVMDAPGVYTGLTIPEKASKSVLFANWGSAVNPAEIVRVDPATKERRFLTSVNTEKAAAIDWQPLREFWFTNEQGDRIHNFIALPPNFDEKKKYPLFVLIHGGAANMWRDAITLRWNYHLIAQPGYVVLLTDYRGSTGYGEKFTLRLVGDPLRGPANDVNRGADEAIRLYPFIDATRQAAGGASYGGHLANWLEGTTSRYKCLVSHAGLSNLEAQWGTSDAIFHRELTALGPPWEQSVVWREQNPIRLAANFKTPMLLSVGENDFRVPLNNTLEMWSALQRMKVPSRLLVWPNENHWIQKPENSRVFYRELHDWLARWLK